MILTDSNQSTQGRRAGFPIINRLLLGAMLLVPAAAFGAEAAEQAHYGLLSLLPALVTLVVCFWTKNVILGLFLGVVLGGAVTGEYNIIRAYLIPSLGSERYAQILLVYLWALGGLIGIWNKTGGAQHFAASAAKRFVKSRRSAKLFAWVLGVIFHQGGTISTVLTGTTVRPVSDKEGVSHEELSYIVDSTASPIATVIPFNVWPAYVAGLIAIDSLSELVPDNASALAWFYKAIPYNFYGLIAVTFTLLFALDRLPWVGKRMRTAIERAKTTGQLDHPDAEPIITQELSVANVPEGYKPALMDFFIPIGVLLGFSIVPWALGGSPLVFQAFGLAVVTAMILAVVRGLPAVDAFQGLLDGIKGVTVGAVILGLAVTLGNVSEALGAGAFIISETSGVLRMLPFVLPGALMILCMLVSFSIGSSWGTYAVVYPIALPLAVSVNPDPTFFVLNFAAVLGGSVFGDQCSPFSDTTVLSAMACGADVMDHVLTQLPLALAAAGLSILAYTVLAFGIQI